MFSSPGLVFVGLCIALSRNYTPTSGQVAIREVLLFEKWFLFALYSVFVKSVMIDALRTLRCRMRSYSIFSFLLYSLGLQVDWPHR